MAFISKAGMMKNCKGFYEWKEEGDNAARQHRNTRLGYHQLRVPNKHKVCSPGHKDGYRKAQLLKLHQFKQKKHLLKLKNFGVVMEFMFYGFLGLLYFY